MPMPKGDKVMDHGAYQRKLRNKDNYPESSLRFIMADAKKAIESLPDNPNNGYYADEILYAAAELRRRGIA
jgi:hypothetical protein